MITDEEMEERYGKLVHIEEYKPAHDRWDLLHRYVQVPAAHALCQDYEAEGKIVRIIEEL